MSLGCVVAIYFSKAFFCARRIYCGNENVYISVKTLNRPSSKSFHHFCLCSVIGEILEKTKKSWWYLLKQICKNGNIGRVKDDKTFENENTLKFLRKERGCILSLEFHATRPPHCFVFNILYFVLSLCSSLRIPLSPSSWFCITQCYI